MQTGVRTDDLGFVFAQPDGDPLNPDHFSQGFQRLIARMDLPKIRLHDLRHTHATLLLNSTIQVYQHVLPGMQADAVVPFGEIVFRSDLYFSGGP